MNLSRDSTICASATRGSRLSAKSIGSSQHQHHLPLDQQIEDEETPGWHSSQKVKSFDKETAVTKSQTFQEGQQRKFTQRQTKLRGMPLKITTSRAAKRKLEFTSSPFADLPSSGGEEDLANSLEEIFKQRPKGLSSLPSLFEFGNPKMRTSISQTASFATSFKDAESRFYREADKSNFYMPRNNFNMEPDKPCDENFGTQSYESLLSKYTGFEQDGTDIEKLTSSDDISDQEINSILDEPLHLSPTHSELLFPSNKEPHYISSPLLASPPPKKQILQDATEFCANYQSLSQSSLVDETKVPGEAGVNETAFLEDITTFNMRLQGMNVEEIMNLVKKLAASPVSTG